LICPEGEKDCSYELCQEGNADEIECNDPEQFNIDHPEVEGECEEGDEECLAQEESADSEDLSADEEECDSETEDCGADAASEGATDEEIEE
jgi:hypothetical protein